MTKWMRGVALMATVLVATFVGAAWANVQEPIAAAEEANTPAENLCEPVDAADAAVAAPESDQSSEVQADTDDAALTPEPQRELFLPYPIPKIDRERVFNWVEEILSYLDRDGESDLVETWQSLARRLEEQPNIVWDELVDELGSVGAEWLAEQLEFMKGIREEMRSSIKQLRQETLDVIREHLQELEATDAPDDESNVDVDIDAEDTGEASQ